MPTAQKSPQALSRPKRQLEFQTFHDGIQVVVGDSLLVLPALKADSIQCCVTSPPYWGLRDYDHPEQVGAEETPEQYVSNLVSIFREVRRVLRKDGTVWLNVGDGYARNGGTGNCGPNAVVGNTKKLIQKRNCKVPECWGLKDRDLLGMPWRVAFALQEDGWILRSHITWIKKTAMPEISQRAAMTRQATCERSARIATRVCKTRHHQSQIESTCCRKSAGQRLRTRKRFSIGSYKSSDSKSGTRSATDPRHFQRQY